MQRGQGGGTKARQREELVRRACQIRDGGWRLATRFCDIALNSEQTRRVGWTAGVFRRMARLVECLQCLGSVAARGAGPRRAEQPIRMLLLVARLLCRGHKLPFSIFPRL